MRSGCKHLTKTQAALAVFLIYLCPLCNNFTYKIGFFLAYLVLLFIPTYINKINISLFYSTQY